MVYLEKMTVKGNVYYKLVHTIKQGKKITHRAKYLGKSLPPKERVEQLKKEFLLQLTSKKYQYLSESDIDAIEHKRSAYQKEMHVCSPLEREKRLNEFMVRFTYESSKLSGVMVTLRQTSLVLNEGIIPTDIKNVTTIKELENHKKGVLIIIKYGGAFTPRFVKKLHAILFDGVDSIIAGKTRDELQRNVKLAGTPYVPPPWRMVKKEWPSLFAWHKAQGRKLHPIELAAILHLKVISLQPFVDGNSRLSRLLMNWTLWKKKYPPVHIPIEDLERYYAALDKYQIEKDEKPFIDYIKKRYLAS
ncbi:Fic family protein [Candidatus Woesearchaeota archaeon]|nr:Fic family protein [Candidatus Woesearchaeota archaeon]